MITPYYEEPGIQIYCGDCREILPQLGPVDVVITDPPYGESYSPAQNSRKAWAPKTFVGKCVVRGDDEPFEPAFLLNYPVVLLFGANNYADKLPASRHWIVWDKREWLPSNSLGDCELIWVSTKGVTRIFRHLWNGMLRASEQGEPRVHPTQKPLVLMNWLVGQYTAVEHVILDPFMGSGTTLVAAKNLGRRAIGIEIERKYCDIVIDRLRQSVLFPAKGER